MSLPHQVTSEDKLLCHLFLCKIILECLKRFYDEMSILWCIEPAHPGY
jgi:hypothetical protein